MTNEPSTEREQEIREVNFKAALANIAETESICNRKLSRISRTQSKVESERWAAYEHTLESASTPAEIRQFTKLLPARHNLRLKAYFKTVDLAGSREDMLQAPFPGGCCFYGDDEASMLKVCAKWVAFCTEELVRANTLSELWDVYEKYSPGRNRHGLTNYLHYPYDGNKPWDDAAIRLVLPFKDCKSLDELEALKKEHADLFARSYRFANYSNYNCILYGAYDNAYGRLYKEKHGAPPRRPSW